MNHSCSSAVKLLNLLSSRHLRPCPNFGPLLFCQKLGLWPWSHGKPPPARRPGREPQSKWRGQLGSGTPGCEGTGCGGGRGTLVLGNRQHPPQTLPIAETPKGKVTPPPAALGGVHDRWRPGESPARPGFCPLVLPTPPHLSVILLKPPLFPPHRAPRCAAKGSPRAWKGVSKQK